MSPKMFHSILGGCCICGLRSSSSRFTSSKRYCELFLGCFGVTENERGGDICNPCVLKVKRFAALPKGSNKNWFGTVDSKKFVREVSRKIKKSPLRRSKGPSPSTPTGNSPKRAQFAFNSVSPIAKKQLYRPKELGTPAEGPNPLAVSPIKKKHYYIAKRVAGNHPGKDVSTSGSAKRKQQIPVKRIYGTPKAKGVFRGFLDPNVWTRKVVCCGLIHIGPTNEVAVDYRFYSPCAARRADKGSCFLDSCYIVAVHTPNSNKNNNEGEGSTSDEKSPAEKDQETSSSSERNLFEDSLASTPSTSSATSTTSF